MKKKIVCFICAVFCCSLLLAQEKKDALKLYNLGRDYESAGDMVSAEARFLESAEVCRTELKENSRNIESYVVLCWDLIRLKNYREAVNMCNEALKINAKEYRIIETKGEAYFYLDNYTESLKCFETYLSGLPNGARNVVAMFFVAEAYRLMGKYEHADIAYCMALNKDPRNALYWFRLGRSRESANNKAGAKEAYTNALKYRANYPEAQEALKRVS
jgi:tetratricopeptide (TPR) repeat protein